MFDVGFQEMLLIMVLALIVFGPSRLPELGKMVGRAIREFKRASDEFRATVETNLNMSEVNAELSKLTLDEPKPEPLPATPSIAPPVLPAAVETGAANGAAAEPDGHVAADSGSEPGGVAIAVATDPYWAQRGSRLFHSRDCAWAARISDRVPFESVAQAREQGYVACPACETSEAGVTV